MRIDGVALAAAAIAGLFIAAPQPAHSQTVMTLQQTSKSTTDLDDMLKRRVVRILVPSSKTYFFLDRGTARGVDAELGQQLEKWLNQNHKPANGFRILVAFVPTPRDRLLQDLNAGLGDIAAGGLTITPERRAIADFSAPFATGIREVLVTGPAAPPVPNLNALGGRELMVRASSSYFTHVAALSERLAKDGEAVRIVKADENLEDEDFLDMVGRGLLPWVVVDRFKARMWASIIPNLTIRDDLVINDGGEMAWAIRADNPKLKTALMEFVAKHKIGTALGSDINLRYFKTGKPIKNALDKKEVEKFRSMAALFRKYGLAYNIDPTLVAAQGYQESGLDQSRRNPSGAVGVMQIKPSTAADKAIGISGVATSADANIQAGAKYLRYMATQYIKEPEVADRERVLLALAAYNAGPGSLRRFREYAAKHGLDPNVWFRNVELAAAAVKGLEPVQYVSNIYKYHVAYSALDGKE